MADLTAFLKSVTSLAGAALRSFALTLLGMAGLGLVLAGIAFYLAAQTSTAYGLLAALAAVVLCTAAGVVVAGKRAVVAALVRGGRTQRLGASAVQVVFDRLLGVSEGLAPGARGGQVVRAVERLPLAQAETRLTQVVTDLVRAEPGGGGLTGWLRRKVQGRLLELVQSCTLTRLRAEGTGPGGVDLVKVRNQLGEQIDGLLVDRLSRGAAWITGMFVAGTIAAALGIALALQRL